MREARRRGGEARASAPHASFVPMSLPTIQELQRLAYQGVRLEITGGRTTWEAAPGALHNGVVDDIRQNLTRHNPATAACGCYHIAATYIEFAPGLLRRPDIAVFCVKPPRPDGAITGIIPGAVIEVLSQGYEQKDRDAVALCAWSSPFRPPSCSPGSSTARRATSGSSSCCTPPSTTAPGSGCRSRWACMVRWPS
ncbi:hypothetical protein CJ255_19870 [Candidatus Viridilinea mediisalina]|uniref:Putative restriction endonuclease domain-containing protein n=1 Tax=Candidatus Viridilinea mediisalina TaxID=2024553 RepID=A0A2A6REJ4_9CHLR|nr:hypothetical protein CJ255_19870 [Candidatus Viridilinea mediisalina]